MINSFFVLIIFIMQLYKDSLHISWPLGVKYKISYNPENKQVSKIRT